MTIRRHLVLCLTALAAVSAAPTQPARQQTQQTRPAGRIPAGVSVHRDIQYSQAGDIKLLLDLYLPAKAPPGPLPVVVWIHGGAWRRGSKTPCPIVFMALSGYAVVSINYRLSQEAPFPAQIEDCQAAVRWLRAHAKEYNLDGDRIGVWGASAGGHLAALLGTMGNRSSSQPAADNSQCSTAVQAVCDWFGPSDFRPLDKTRQDEHASAIEMLLGGPIRENLDKAAEASPVAHVSKDDPPFLIMHGDQDKLVPLEQSKALHQALQQAGVDSTLRIIEGAGHGTGAFASPELRQEAKAFFDKHLKGQRIGTASAPAVEAR